MRSWTRTFALSYLGTNPPQPVCSKEAQVFACSSMRHSFQVLSPHFAFLSTTVPTCNAAGSTMLLFPNRHHVFRHPITFSSSESSSFGYGHLVGVSSILYGFCISYLLSTCTSFNEMTLYEYTALNDNEFQLLQIRPGPDSQSVSIDLITHRLPFETGKIFHPLYTVVSHYGGSEVADGVVMVNGKTLPIRPNLDALLR